MHVKTFTGKSNKKILEQIKLEFGDDAVILESRNFTDDDGQTSYRILAALERNNDADEIITEATAPLAASYPNAEKHWQAEWQQMKSHLFALMHPVLNLDILTEKQRTTIEYLKNEGVNQQSIFELYRKLIAAKDSSVLNILSESLPVRGWSSTNWPQRYHLISGPFGVGKTSTAVRLALTLRKQNKNAKICIINADIERGQGRLLLKHYAGLSDFTYYEVKTPSEMRALFVQTQQENFDKVIIDLPGLTNNLNLTGLLSNLGLSGLDGMQSAIHLVLSPYYNECTLNSLLGRYRVDLPGSIIWSKLDEAENYGAILNVALTSGLPISAFSFSPSLLNSLAEATQSALWRLVFKHELPIAN